MTILFHRIKLNEVLKKALMLLNDHCIGYTNELYQKMVEWSRSVFCWKHLTYNNHFFWKHSFLPCGAKVRCLPPIWSLSIYFWLLPIQAKPNNYSTHSPQVFLPLPYTSTSPQPPSFFCSLTPIHPHSYAPDAQTICHTSPHPLHSVYPEDCTNLHRYLSFTDIPHIHLTIIRSILSPDYPDFLPSMPMFQSCIATHHRHMICISFPLYDASQAVKIGDNCLNLAQSNFTLALAASSAPPPAPSVSPKIAKLGCTFQLWFG